ncbi:MAG TPA: YbaN family protein [Xanthomonadales bacterium]
MRLLLFILGWLFFGAGFVGVFVPVLPTTPLMLLALWCFARSSGRFHDWLYTHRIFGPPLQQYREHRVIPVVAKCAALLFMTSSLVYLLVFLKMAVWMKVLISCTMALGAWFILSKPSLPPEKAAEPE